MLAKEEVLKNYKKLETCIDNRFFKRICKYLTADEIESLEIVEFKDEEARNDWSPLKEWTEENIVEELVSDAEFGLQKAEDERGISSSLMTEVCEAWLFVLEDDELESSDWGYNYHFFKDILDKYGDKD